MAGGGLNVCCAQPAFACRPTSDSPQILTSWVLGLTGHFDDPFGSRMQWIAMISVFIRRRGLFVIYILVTVIACGEIFFRGSFSASGAGLLGSVLCYFGTASFVGPWLARRKKNYGQGDLSAIGATAVVLVAGIALLAWSGFRFKVFDVVIVGPAWAAIGIVVAMLAAKRKRG